MSNVTKKPLFWVAYALLSTAALAVALQLFPVAIPLVNLDITMNRAAAIASAEALAEKYGLAPAGARSAARFDHDGTTQNYVELEGGGRAAFAALTLGDLYSPYWWDVRLFALGTIDETIIRFRPDGARNGFVRRVAETYVRDPATKALDAASARALAEERARADWGVDFSHYTLHDQSQQTLPSGRIDHTFVYERPEKLAEARIRLRLSVSGDELMGVAPFVFVPESFERRFQELRSANNLIAGVASGSAGLLYGIGGCILGSLWLMRRHWLLWRPAFVTGLVVAALLAFAQLASAPAAWFGADTTETPATFWLKQGGAFVFILTAVGLGLTLAFMAAESLSRAAFPHHPQLWRLWSREAGSTKAVAGRTAGGYLFVPIELALIAVFYYATNHWLGWWQPSENMSDPNILSSAIPALSPIAMSLQAGFMEECVFRAIPLALGALVGQHFGRRGLGIAIAFVLQALVFGGAHANYPGLPAYSRLVELIVPSMIWALIFLRFGLLPTILLHATFDLVLFAIPVFLVDAAGARVQQALIIAAGLVPLAVVLARRIQSGAWTEMADALRNGAWRPAAVTAAESSAPAHDEARPQDRLAIGFQRALPVLAIGGFLCWLFLSPFRTDVPPLPIDRAAAVAFADQALAARGVTPGPEWRRLSAVKLASDDGQQWGWHKFIWREAGADTYRSLIGSALPPPLWEVRYATFDGDVAERAEEWRVTIAPDGQVRTLRHVIPEGRAGARLTREAALAVAEKELRARFGLDPAALKQVAAEEEKRPARTDWGFMFTDPRVDLGKDGELRYVVNLAGDEVVGSGRVVHVPETWLRAERERDNRQQVVRMGAGILFLICGLAALVLGIIGWSRGRCDTRAAYWVGGIAFALALLSMVNAWPLQAMQLKTAEPVASQYFMLAMGAFVGGLLTAILFGVIAGIGAWYARSAPRHPLAGWLPPWGAAIAAALLVAGLQAVIGNLGSRQAPVWPPLQGAGLWWPFGGAVLTGLGFVSTAGIALFVVHTVARLTSQWQRRAWIGVAVVVVLQGGLALLQAGTNLGAAAAAGLVGGLAVAAVLWLLLRYDARIVPAYVATGAVLTLVMRAIQDGTTSGYVAGAAAAVATAATAWAVTRYIAAPLPPSAATKPAPTAASPNTA